jgi:hypothetical protein
MKLVGWTFNTLYGVSEESRKVTKVCVCVCVWYVVCDVMTDL